MTIPKGIRTNFETLQRAFANDDVALLEVVRKDNGATAYVIVAVNVDVGGVSNLIPFAELRKVDLMDEFNPPSLGPQLGNSSTD